MKKKKENIIDKRKKKERKQTREADKERKEVEERMKRPDIIGSNHETIWLQCVAAKEWVCPFYSVCV